MKLNKTQHKDRDGNTSPDCLRASNTTLSPPPGYVLEGRFAVPERGHRPPERPGQADHSVLLIVGMALYILFMIFRAVTSSRNHVVGCEVPSPSPSGSPPPSPTGVGLGVLQMSASAGTEPTMRTAAVAVATGASGARVRGGARRRRKRRQHGVSRAASKLSPAHPDSDTSDDEGLGHGSSVGGTGLKRRRMRLYRRGEF